MEDLALIADLLRRECAGVIHFRARDIAGALGLPPGALDYYFAGDAPDFSGFGDFHANSDSPGKAASNLCDAAGAVGTIVEKSPKFARAFWRATLSGAGLLFCSDKSPRATATQLPTRANFTYK